MGDNVHDRWQSTDSGGNAASEQTTSHEKSPSERAPSSPSHSAHVAVEPTHVSLRLAAATGIALVLAAFATFYFGIDFLRASLTGITVQEVRIAEDGGFWPDSVTLAPGDEIRVINENADPQVIKNKENPDAFDRPAIFPGEEAMLKIPAETPAGTYIFYSETLSEDLTLAVNVITDAGSQVTGDGEVLEDAIGEILIPDLAQFAAEQPAASAPQSSSSSSHNAPQLIADPSEEVIASPPPSSPPLPSQPEQAPPLEPTPSFTIGGEDENARNPFFDSAAIPVNPYTVGNIGARPLPPKQETTQLHQGAPLRSHRPTSQPSTGPGTWLAATAFVLTLSLGLKIAKQKIEQ